MGTRLIEPPVDEPVSVDEVKANLRVDHTDDDGLLAQLITDAREWLETRIQQKLMSQTWDFIIDYFPSAEIKLPFGPVQSIVRVAYYDAGGVEQIVDSADYYLDNTSSDAWVFPVASWPTSLLDAVNAASVRFVAGYSQKEYVPGGIKRALHLKVQDFYEGTDSDRAIHDLLTNHYLMVA